MKPNAISKVVFAALLVVLGLGAAPTSPRAAPEDEKLTRALALTKEGKYAEALAEYEAMLKTSPLAKVALERMGPLLFLTGDHQRAMVLYRRVTRSLPGYARGHYFYAYALRKLGEHKEALAAYAAYRRLEPTSAHALYGMAACHQALGQEAEALKTYRTFIAMAAKAPEKDNLGGWILRASQEAEALQKKIDLAKTDAATKEVLAAADKAIRDGQQLEAEKLLRQGYAALKEPAALGEALGSLLVRLRRFDEALPVLAALLQKDPAHTDGRYLLALALRFTGKHKEAAEAYRAVIKAQADHPDAHYGLAETLRQLGDVKEAIRLYERYVAIEKRPLEQQFVTKAREQIEALKTQLAAARPEPPRPEPDRPGPDVATTGTGEPSLEGITDPRVRAILEARRRMALRGQGQEVPGPGPATGPTRSDPTDAAAERHRQREEAALKRAEAAEKRRQESARKREEARQKALELKRQREETAEKRRQEITRRQEEARQKALELKRQREEAAERRRQEIAQREREAKERAARAQAEQAATRILAGGAGDVTPEVQEILLGWAGAATGAGNHARALAAWKILARERPTDPTTLESLAAAATAAGDHRAAVEAYRALVKAKPKRRELYAKLRAAEAKAGLPLTPLPMEVVLPAEVREGRRLLSAGKAAEAHALAERRVKAEPTDGLAAVLFADALFALGRYEDALKTAERAAGAHPKLAGPHRLLGAEHLRLRSRSAALSAYRRFLKALVGDPTEEHHRALVTAIVKRLE